MHLPACFAPSTSSSAQGSCVCSSLSSGLSFSHGWPSQSVSSTTFASITGYSGTPSTSMAFGLTFSSSSSSSSLPDDSHWCSSSSSSFYGSPPPQELASLSGDGLKEIPILQSLEVTDDDSSTLGEVGFFDPLESDKSDESDSLSTTIYKELKSGNFKTLENCLTHNSLTKTDFDEINTSLLKHERNFILLLINKKEFKLLNLLIEKNFLTPEDFSDKHEGWVAIARIAFFKQYELIEQFIDKNFITRDLLNVTIPDGSNIIWHLIANEQYVLIKKLINLNVITSDHLKVFPLSKSNINRGINCVMLLALNKQYELIEDLLNKNLITSEHLCDCSDHRNSPNYGVNAVLILAWYKQVPLIQRFFEKGLLTSAVFDSCIRAEKHSFKGVNAPWLMANGGSFGFMEELFRNKKGNCETSSLITSDHLSASPSEPTDSNSNTNVLYLLALYSPNLIGLLLQKNLITSQLLKSYCAGEENSTWGIDVTLLLALKKWALR